MDSDVFGDENQEVSFDIQKINYAVNAYKVSHESSDAQRVWAANYAQDPNYDSPYKMSMQSADLDQYRHGVTKLDMHVSTSGNYGMKFSMILILADDPYPNS